MTRTEWNFRDLVLATPATRAPLFVTATTSSRATQHEDPKPLSMAHAKEMGSTTTLCGLPAGSWPRFFHLAFPPGDGEVCPGCLDLGLQRRRPRRRARLGRPAPSDT